MLLLSVNVSSASSPMQYMEIFTWMSSKILSAKCCHSAKQIVIQSIHIKHRRGFVTAKDEDRECVSPKTSGR